MRTLLIATIFLAAGCDSASRGCQQGVEDAHADMAGCPTTESNDAALHTLLYSRRHSVLFLEYHAQCYDGEKGRLAAECAAQADTGL